MSTGLPKGPRRLRSEPKSEVESFVYIAVGVAAIGGLLFGYDTGVISGAILFSKAQFLLSSAMEEIVVSAVLVGAAIGAIGGILTDRFGRRGIIILAGMIFTASAYRSGAHGDLADCRQGSEWTRYRHRFLYLPDVHRRTGTLGYSCAAASTV